VPEVDRISAVEAVAEQAEPLLDRPRAPARPALDEQVSERQAGELLAQGGIDEAGLGNRLSGLRREVIDRTSHGTQP
jgi:hypothetical protein